MEGGELKKGTVTPLSELFPVEDTRKVIKRVEDLIKDKQSELEVLRQYIAENTSLINLITKLPEELHHRVMIPFGKAAFFPGSLLHTNEFTVLIGENYFVERSAKQTTQMLTRRGKILESQVGSLDANIRNLTAEASFFASTSYDADEGVVEIKEDYAEGQAEPDKFESQGVVDDDEYAMMMSRLDELEQEETAAEDDGINEFEEIASAEDDYDSVGLIDTLLHKSLNLNKSGDNQLHSNRSKSSSSIQAPRTNMPSTTEIDDTQISTSKDQSAGRIQPFTGSIVERTDNFKAATTQDANIQSSKPVSRFKMQRK